MFHFWTEADAARRLAWAKGEAAEEMLEMSKLHLRQRQTYLQQNGLEYGLIRRKNEYNYSKLPVNLKDEANRISPRRGRRY